MVFFRKKRREMVHLTASVFLVLWSMNALGEPSVPAACEFVSSVGSIVKCNDSVGIGVPGNGNKSLDVNNVGGSPLFNESLNSQVWALDSSASSGGFVTRNDIKSGSLYENSTQSPYLVVFHRGGSANNPALAFLLGKGGKVALSESPDKSAWKILDDNNNSLGRIDNLTHISLYFTQTESAPIPSAAPAMMFLFGVVVFMRRKRRPS